jgi:hypothetical protein
MTAAPVVSTYSMWSLFRNCRKAVDWRYQQRLVPLQRDRNLHFGSLIHECLKAWHQRRDLDEVLALIDKLRPNHLQDDNQRRDWHLAIAMTKAYAVQYATESFEVIGTGKELRGPHRKPRQRRGVAKFCARRQGGRHRPHPRRALHPRT